MKIYRAMSYTELEELGTTGMLRSAPPSFQGKWFALTIEDAAEWGRRLAQLGNPPFQLAECEIDDADFAILFHHEFWDRIGPACFVEEAQFGLVRFVREIADVPTEWTPRSRDSG
jgi:hypothetical protein